MVVQIFENRLAFTHSGCHAVERVRHAAHVAAIVVGPTPGDAAKWLIAEVEKRGVSRARVLQGTGLDAEWLNDKDAFLNAQQYSRLVLNALHESGDPALGLTASLQGNYLSRFGYWGYAILSSADLGQASRLALRYWEVTGSLVRLMFQDEGDTCAWEIFPVLATANEEILIFAVEKLLSALFATIEFTTGSPPPIREIQLSYQPPEHAFLYGEYWKAKVLFGQEKNLFRMDASILKRPILLANPRIMETCLEQCRELLFKLRRMDEMVELVRRVILASPGHFPNGEETAKKLGMSPRTLRRRLQERNTSYRKLLDEVRFELATGYLTTTSLTIDEIADLLGYIYRSHHVSQILQEMGGKVRFGNAKRGGVRGQKQTPHPAHPNCSRL